MDELFARYLGALESGRSVDLEAFLERAGEEREELRRLVEFSEGLAPEEPLRFGRFEIQRAIRSGGQGRVYRAWDPDLGRLVALKVFEQTQLDELERQWILNEARSIAKLEHPGVVRIFDVGEQGGRAFIVMEYLSGPSLADVIRTLCGEEESPPQDVAHAARRLRGPRERIACLVRLAEALAYCHERGVLHRDVNPSNVLFGDDGLPRYVDFGLAHLEEREGVVPPLITQRLIGTPGYLAPEQLDANETGADPRSDQYAFATIAFELLCRRWRFPERRHTEIRAAILEDRAPKGLLAFDGAIPARLDRVVRKGLAHEPDDRYRNMGELAADLRAVLENRPVSVVAPSLFERLRLWRRRHAARVNAALSLAALLTVALLALQVVAARADRAEVRAELQALDLEVHGARRLADVGRRLEALLARARRLDDARTAALFRPVGPAVEERVDAWAEHVARAQRRARSIAEEQGTRFQVHRWSEVEDLRHRMRPEGFDAGEGKRIVLPEDVPEGVSPQLYEQVVRMGERSAETGPLRFPIVEYVPIEWVERPVSGMYLVLGWGSRRERPLYQIQFLVQEQQREPLELLFRPPDARALASTVPVRPSPTLLRELFRTDELPDFRIGRELVTRGEFLRFLDATGEEPAGQMTWRQAEDAPAWVRNDQAFAYARWVGGRLPASMELVLADRAGRIEIPTEDSPDGHGEWVGELFLGSSERTSFFRYPSYGKEDVIPLKDASYRSSVQTRTETPQGKEVSVGIGFRIAFCDDRSQAYSDRE